MVAAEDKVLQSGGRTWQHQSSTKAANKCTHGWWTEIGEAQTDHLGLGPKDAKRI